jgi:hypothetical protein
MYIHNTLLHPPASFIVLLKTRQNAKSDNHASSVQRKYHLPSKYFVFWHFVNISNIFFPISQAN